MRNILILLLLMLNLPLWAQEGKLSEEKRNEFEAQKVAFFTQKLDLTPAEAAAFWPLYNEMEKKVRGKERTMREIFYQMGKVKDPTEAQSQKVVKDMLALEQGMLDIKKDYYQQMMKVVSASKVYKLDWVERKFHKQLLEKLKHPDGRK